MKRLLLVTALLTALSIAGSFFKSQPAAASTEFQDKKPIGPAVLCLPGVYLSDPGDCQPAGPSGYLTQMAGKGITFPIPALPASKPDPGLVQIDINYAEVKTNNAPVYGSMDAAISHDKKQAVQHLNGDFVFVSYTNLQETGGKKLYEINSGQWMTAADLLRLGVLPRFQGLQFTSTPLISFGWILTYFTPNAQIETQHTPGSENSDFTGHQLNLNDVVQIFAEKTVGKDRWYMVGPDEWIAQKYVARVTPNTTPPKGVTGGRWIEVNLAEQTLAVYDKRQMVFATVVASGAEPFWTQPGAFQIYKKLEKTLMSGASETSGKDAYYLEDVPWTMYYDGPRALHGAYWRAKMGFPQSHGCVNMTVGDAHWLFNWAQNGDWVYVWDPTGQTPTDPKLYGSGGY